VPQGTSRTTGKPFWSGDTVNGYEDEDAKGDNGPVKPGQIVKPASGTFSIKAALTGGPTSQIGNERSQIFKARKPTAVGTYGVPPLTTTAPSTLVTTTSTTLYRPPSRAFVDPIMGLLG